MPTALIVDDVAFVRATLGRIAGAAGFAVIEASDEVSTLRAYRAHTPDVVMLDLNLGSVSGLDVLRSLRAMDEAARVIVVSAERAVVVVRDVLEAGAVDFVAKPFTRERVTAALRRALPVLAADLD